MWKFQFALISLPFLLRPEYRSATVYKDTFLSPTKYTSYRGNKSISSSCEIVCEKHRGLHLRGIKDTRGEDT
ncbi:predicted protein [Sclerotinia sclerotiorum 1980 UF-70]|uniref:Secreted protein n=1 Tax=Sclerotinia sclerotiorum (strain ATCC 18683 / 1980 / Ss-1) TaxID=665079 RepID=A7E618_SCLS1|nr:predicted protein [Sclerotinia sclerotiorum 1980 UF-70]EDN91340.1 predicted protein [Sclerotinia sclerotiorum 1980 UF-70]